MQNIKNIAVISSNIVNGFSARILRAMQEESLDTPYDLEIYFARSVDKKGGTEYLYDKIAGQKKVSAIVTIAYPIFEKHIIAFKEAGIIPVIIDTRSRGVSSINTNNEKGGYDAVKYLLETGRRSIGIITGDNILHAPQRERLTGYMKALAEKHIGFNEGFVRIVPNYSYQDGKEAFGFMLSAGADAVFCAAGDYVAHGFLNEARQRGFEIPDSMALIGFDDIGMSAETGLTTVKQPLDEIGKEAFRMAVSAIERPDLPAQVKIFDNTLIIRDTA